MSTPPSCNNPRFAPKGSSVTMPHHPERRQRMVMHRAVRVATILLALGWAAAGAAAAAANPKPAMDPAAAGRFAALALKCLHAEYPNHISHTLDGDADALPPHVLKI